MAAISDKITKTMDIGNPTTTTVASQRSAGATELRAVSLDGWQQQTAMHFSTYRLNSQGEYIDGSQTDWKGVVNLQANAIVNIKRVGGAEDSGNLVGDIIEAMPTAAWADDLADALLIHHDTGGNLKPETITYDHINAGTEYKQILSPNDLNDPLFLVPGKWRFGTDTQVASTKNLPITGKTGFLETISHSGGETRPGTHSNSHIVQIFTGLDGGMYVRAIFSKAVASTVDYGKWQLVAGNPAKTAKDANGWIKRELPGGITEYTIVKVFEVTTPANSWYSSITINLPVEVGKFDQSTMSANMNVRSQDAVVNTSVSIVNNQTAFTIDRFNHYGHSVTTNFEVNGTVRVYPE